MELVKAMNIFGTSVSKDIYEVRNKDTVLGEFYWEDEDTAILLDGSELPFFILDDFSEWITTRTPPKHREHIDRLLQHLNLHSVKSIIDFSKGLTLTDTFWSVPKGSSIRWKDVSLFQNPFDDVIARIAFDGGLYGIPLSTTSPELGTNGMLAKCWIRKPGGRIFLLKTGTSGASNAGNEPYSENLAHQVLTRLGYPHVPYTVSHYRRKLVSECPLFTSEKDMLVPIYRYYNFRSIDKLLALCERDGISEGLAQHLVFDYLSWNTDRHAGNLGVLLDADSFELKGLAPIFDNGISMLNFWDGKENLDYYTTLSTPALYNSFERGAKLGRKILGNHHHVNNLIGFKFDRNQVPGYPDERVSTIEDWLQTRVRWFLSLG